MLKVVKKTCMAKIEHFVNLIRLYLGFLPLDLQFFCAYPIIQPLIVADRDENFEHPMLRS